MPTLWPGIWSCGIAAARTSVWGAGQAEYAFIPMKDGDALEFPGLRLQILETPGHTIESISILAFDLQKAADKPYAVLTGDTLFIGDVGRPTARFSRLDGSGAQRAPL